MMRTIEEAREEAVRRMRRLGVHINVVNEFRKGKLNKSEFGGFLYWLNEEEQKMVKDYEAESEGKRLVYHVIHQFTNLGELYNLLYVYLDDEDWETDNEWLAAGEVVAYTVNKTMPDCSEAGCIGIQPSIGGLIRTW